MIKDKLKEIREKANMNKKEFAEFINVKYTTYNGYETGSREPDSDFLVLISKKFDVSTDYILGLRDDAEIAHSYQLKSSEYEHIKKYRDLDPHGKDMVDTVLEKEHDRCLIDDNILELPPRQENILNAAHERTDIEITDEMRKHDDDIMNDPNF